MTMNDLSAFSGKGVNFRQLQLGNKNLLQAGIWNTSA